MAKGSGSTRASGSGNPKGFVPYNLNEELAERWYRNGALMVDPGDATYEQARNLRPDQIEESIDNLTDYTAMASVDGGGKVTDITIIPKNFSSEDLVKDYGDDVFKMPVENRVLTDIIVELRDTGMSKLFRKYR